ncbi:hypothetical protein BDZ91DRAFT_769233 [Kalaharituber pfeilii]|nr:hypothetical protein BDZ91DRAFT_769233 [Kalaharituber pfeilii]
MAETIDLTQENEFETSFSLYKVRWKGWGKEHDTWEPEGNLAGCSEMLAAWRIQMAKSWLTGPSRGDHKAYSSNNKRKTDAMDIDDASPGSSSSEFPTRPTKSQRTPRGAGIQCDRKIFLEKLSKIPGPPITLFNDHDHDPCPPISFEFVLRYKMGDGVIDFVKENSDFWAGCSCEGGKCTKNCSCVQEGGYHGKLYYDKNGRLILSDNDIAIHECNDRCSCDVDCSNRVVQRGRKIPLEIFKTENKGWGLRCPQRIPKGTFIDTYPGELITTEEAEKRALVYSASGLSYLFDLDKFSKVRKTEEDENDPWSEYRESAVETVDPKDIYVIDGKDFGGVTRFINHSCDPNLLIYAVTRERADDRLYDLAMFAHKDIPAYQELTFSYVGGDKGEPDADAQRWECYCGASLCKGYLW